MSASRWLAGAVTALACGAAACGGSGDDGQRAKVPGAAGERATPTPEPGTGERATPTPRPGPSATPRPEPDAARPSDVDPAAVRVVRAWADTLRQGDVRGAAEYFALPSRVSNGTAPLKLETRAQARFFNRALPCGAKVIDTEPAPRGFFIATFRLTERPGRGECGSGTGGTARTAFRVRDEHITDWLRVHDIPSAPEILS